MSQNHFVLITGAAGGIGRATVNLFTEKGWRVIGVDRADFGAGFPAKRTLHPLRYFPPRRYARHL